MSTAQRRVGALATTLLASLALSACGNTPADGPKSPPADDVSADRLSERDVTLHQDLPAGLPESVEARAAAFLERHGTALRRSLRDYLGPELTTAVEAGATVCRAGSETPSIDDPRRYPFACIVRGSADGQGLEVGITLGFVGTELDGRCWRAANERVAVTTTVPALLTRDEARRPVNQIAGCV